VRILDSYCAFGKNGVWEVNGPDLKAPVRFDSESKAIRFMDYMEIARRAGRRQLQQELTALLGIHSK